MNRFIRKLLFTESPVASTALVFLSYAFVSIMQLPPHLLMSKGWFSAGVLVNELIIIAGVPLVLIVSLKLDTKRLLPFVRMRWYTVALVIIATLGADVVIDYMTFASEKILPLPWWVKKIYVELMSVKGVGDVVWKLFVLCLAPAVCEEIYFRGFCQTSLTWRFGKMRAVCITALLFAVIHGNPWYLALYFVLGLLFGWLYATTGSLWAPILCHFINNAWTFLNHVGGFHLPVETSPAMVDVFILASGILVFVCCAMLLQKVSRS